MIHHRAIDLDRDIAADLEDTNTVIAIAALVSQTGIGGQHIGSGILAYTIAVRLTFCDQAWLLVTTPV